MLKKGKFKNCETCGSEFYNRPYQVNDPSRRFCSLRCKGMGWNSSGSNNPLWKGGKPNCKLCGKKLSMRGYIYCAHCREKGENSKKWKGEEISVAAKHQWIRKILGKPKQCMDCGSNQNLQYSNIDHKYKRVVTDYIPRCIKCHIKYDVRNGLRSFNENNLRGYLKSRKSNDLPKVS